MNISMQLCLLTGKSHHACCVLALIANTHLGLVNKIRVSIHLSSCFISVKLDFQLSSPLFQIQVQKIFLSEYIFNVINEIIATCPGLPMIKILMNTCSQCYNGQKVLMEKQFTILRMHRRSKRSVMMRSIRYLHLRLEISFGGTTPEKTRVREENWNTIGKVLMR